jgi:pimeloyl-ACP methyl ester carboxylesterase
LNGTELHVAETGDGDVALVFLHYWGGSSRTWTGVIEALGGHWRTVAYDHRGWGESQKTGEDFSLNAMTEDAAALIAALGLKRYVLVGNSMGGKVAQKLAARQPAGLEALVLVAPAPPTPIGLSPEEKSMRLASYESAETVNGMLNALLTRPVSEEVRERTIADTMRACEPAKRAWVDSGMAEDVGEDVRRISVPTLVITGTRDVVDPEPVLRREIGGRLPQARFVVLEGIGHFSPIEAPSEVAVAIATFLATLDI